MSDTTFVLGTTIPVAWLNDINDVVYDLLASAGVIPTTDAQLRANIGSTTVGDALFVAASAATARASLGSTTVGDALFIAANAAAARSAITALLNVLTTRGDLVRAGAAGAAERVALGTSLQVLTSDGTDALWATPIFTKAFTSTAQTVTSAGALTLAHGLGAVPTLIQARLKCIGTEAGYAVNDEIALGLNSEESSAVSRGVSVWPDATNLNCRFGSTATAFSTLNKTTGVAAALTNTNWQLILRAWV